MADFNDIKRLLDFLIDGLHSQEQMNKVGLAGIRKIQERTREGTDVHGRPFKPYSDNHAERREELGLPTHIVNLEMDDISGMLRRVDHIVAADFESVAVDITDEQKRLIASYHNELGVGKTGENIREFWALSAEEEEDIAKIVQRDTDQLLTDLTRDLQ